MKQYNISLANSQTVFDAQNDFPSVKAALNWSIGRGGSYTITIDAGNAENGEFISLSCVDDQLSYFDGWDWTDLSLDDAAKFISKHI